MVLRYPPAAPGMRLVTRERSEPVQFCHCANKAESLPHHGSMRKISRVVAMLATLATGSVLVSAHPAAAATATTTTLTSSVNPSTVGQAVTLSATVAGAAPTGSVTFTESSLTLGSATLSGGVATLVVSTWAAGTHPVTATYSADANND